MECATIDKKKTTDFLAGGVKPKHPLDRFVGKIITNIVDQLVVPWLVSCLEKYSEDDFHQRMMDPNFSFIKDWEDNHPARFSRFLTAARRFKNKYVFEVDLVTAKVVGILEDSGWTVRQYEKIKLRAIIQTIKNRIDYG